MAKRKHATKVFNVGVDTWSTTKHSFINRLRFWKPNRPKSPKSPCEGCRSRKARLGPEVQNRSLTKRAGLSEEMVNPLKAPSMILERAIHDGAHRMVEPSGTSPSVPALIPIPSTAKYSGCCCSNGGNGNQQDGNVGLDVIDAALLDASSVSGESIVNITIDSRHFSESSGSLPEDGQCPSPERGCFLIDVDLEDLSGLSADLLKPPDNITSLARPAVLCPLGLDLEAELKNALESSLPNPEVEIQPSPSPAAPALSKVENEGQSSDLSLTDSFSRTQTSLSSNDGNSAPSHSFHIEKPYSHLGSDFVDVEDYLLQPRDSFPQPTYPALDSLATTEDFGFRPTCECMPGSWLEASSRSFSEEGPATSRTGQDESPSTVQPLSPDLGCPRSFFNSKAEVLKLLECVPYQPPDTSLLFARCRPIPGSFRQSIPSPSPSQSMTGSDSTTSLHLRGGGNPDRFSLFRPVGKGKLVGNIERGKKLLNEQVSDCYFAGGWGRSGTWRELCEKMEKRVEKRKEIEKTETEKEGESAGGIKAMLAWAKGWFDSGKGEEQGEEEMGEAEITLATAQTTVAC
jgi:hypothetical protein